MAAQGDEAFGLDPIATAQDPGDEGPGVVVPDAGGNTAEAREGDHVPFEERLLALGTERDVDRDARMGEAQLEDRDLRSLAADEDIREAEVDLGLLCGVREYAALPGVDRVRAAPEATRRCIFTALPGTRGAHPVGDIGPGACWAAPFAREPAP